MLTFLSYPVIPLATAFVCGENTIPKRLLWVGVFVSMLPGLHFLAYTLNIVFLAELIGGHFSQTIFFDLLIGFIGSLFARWLNKPTHTIFWFLFLSAASHGVLYAITNGSLGTPFLWDYFNFRLPAFLNGKLSPELIARPVVSLAISTALGERIIPKRLAIAGIIISLLPHPNFSVHFHLLSSHVASPLNGKLGRAIFPAIPMALIGAFAAPWLGTRFRTAFWFLFLSCCAYDVLDAISDSNIIGAILQFFETD